MKKILFIFLLLPAVLHAKLKGQPLIDSILQALPKEKEDSNKARILRKLAKLYEFSNPDEGLKYAEQSLVLAEQLDWKKGIGYANEMLASYALNRSDLPRTLEYDFKALKISEERGDKDAICRVVGNIGNVYGSQNNLTKALEYFRRALKMSEDLGDNDGIAANLTNIGNNYANQRKFDTALDYDARALKSYEEQGNKDGIISVLSNIGAVYHSQKNYPKALEYFLRSLKVNETLGNKRYEAGNLGNIGNAYMHIARDTTGTIKPDSLIMPTKAGNLAKAIEYLNRGISLSREIGLNEALLNFDKDIAEAYALMGKYKEAFDSYKEYVVLNDSVFSTDSKVKIATLTAQRETELKNKQIEINRIQEANKKRERAFFILGIGLMFIFIIIVIRNYEKQKKANNLLGAEKVRSENLMRDLERLLRQKDILMKEIHHRVKNNLQVISTLLDLQLINIIDEHAKDAITESMTRVRSISLIHQQLYQNENVSSIEFARFAKDLMQQITAVYKKEGQSIFLKSSIKDVILDIDTAIPLGLILNELITNTYKYAFPPDITEGTIDIGLSRQGDHYLLTYSDSGIGLPAHLDPEQSKTLGMKVMQSLSRQLGGKFIYEKENNCFFITFKDDEGRKLVD